MPVAVRRNSSIDMHARTIKKAVLPLRLAGPLPGTLLTRTLASWTTLALVVLGQLSRVDFVLLQLTPRLRARWLGWRGFFSLEVGVRHACCGQQVILWQHQNAATYSATR